MEIQYKQKYYDGNTNEATKVNTHIFDAISIFKGC